MRLAFGLTEPDHGSDATWLETSAYRDGDEWVINGKKRFNTGLDVASHDMVFARTSGNQGEANGITCFIVPTDTPGFNVEFMWWTFNMPSEHAELTLDNVRVSGPDCILGGEGKGLEMANMFVHENRIRQAASGVGAAQFCVDEAVRYAQQRNVFGRPLWRNQAIQFPLAEMQTRCEMVRNLVYKTAWYLDRNHHMQVSDKVSMANYQANRLVCEAADLAIQVHGGIGYTRHKPFEHIYRHHRRYRITEGSEEIQIRRVAQRLFGVDVKRAAGDPEVVGRWTDPVAGPRWPLRASSAGGDLAGQVDGGVVDGGHQAPRRPDAEVEATKRWPLRSYSSATVPRQLTLAPSWTRPWWGTGLPTWIHGPSTTLPDRIRLARRSTQPGWAMPSSA